MTQHELADGRIRLYHGDCLEIMPTFPDGVIDMVLTDPPYGTTVCKWDSVIPLEPMWTQVWRTTKPKSPAVFTSSQPFTTALISSAMDRFRYCWVWDKKKPANFALAKKQPMKYHEDVVVFSAKPHAYYPIMVPVEGRAKKKGKNDGYRGFNKGLEKPEYLDKVYKDKYPSSILEFSNADQTDRLHPTQKPVALMEYLIKTYTNENDIVLDFAAGSFTTGVACLNLNRRFIGIEKEEEYFNIGINRLEEAARQLVA